MQAELLIDNVFFSKLMQVELLILSHHFYKLSSCLDGVDVLVALAATRVETYVWEGDFSCLARLITGVGNFHALNFILEILIENGQLDLLLQKYSAAADANSGTAEAVRGFRMAVLTSLKQFNPNDLDAFAMVCTFAILSLPLTPAALLSYKNIFQIPLEKSRPLSHHPLWKPNLLSLSLLSLAGL